MPSSAPQADDPDDGIVGQPADHGEDKRCQSRLLPALWEEVLPRLRRELSAAARKDGSSVVGVLSPFLTCEEAFLFAKYLKGLSGEVKLALGPGAGRRAGRHVSQESPR